MGEERERPQGTEERQQASSLMGPRQEQPQEGARTSSWGSREPCDKLQRCKGQRDPGEGEA